MLPLILFLLFSIASMAWAIYGKLKHQLLVPRADRQYSELFTLGLPAVAVLVNAVLVYKFTTTGLSVTEHIVQMLACCSVVPLVYMHFARQVGRRMNNTTTIVLWLLALLVLLPGVVLYNPYAVFEPLRFTPKPFALYVVSHGEKLWAIYTGDLIVILQALITILRVVPLVRNLRENGLHFSRPVMAFFAWWVVTAAFTVVVSSLDMAQLSSTLGTWLYYMGMAFCMVGINTLFALDFDLYPIETEQGEVVENVDAYMDKLYGDLAQQMEEAMAKEQLFRQPGYMVEDMCERLGTNRKVLSQMMQRQYGIHFPEYLNNRRLEYAQQLLLTTDMKMEIVAEESGFADRSHLNRLFKQKFACSPSQWQKEHKIS